MSTTVHLETSLFCRSITQLHRNKQQLEVREVGGSKKKNEKLISKIEWRLKKEVYLRAHQNISGCSR